LIVDGFFADDFTAQFFLVKNPSFGRSIAEVKEKLGQLVSIGDVESEEWSKFYAISTKCAHVFSGAYQDACSRV
jgi:hypothetical protein